jgi:hypothetical protein
MNRSSTYDVRNKTTGVRRIASCVGDDHFGRLNIERLQRDGVDAGTGNTRAGVFACAEASNSQKYAVFHWLFSEQTASRALIQGYAPPD